MPDNIYHFPAEITLLKYPLVEAWLEIHWEPLTQDGEEQRNDSGYLLGLAVFFQSIKDEFRSTEALPSANLPLEMGRIVRHRFRPSPDQWPLIQVGPGIASLNYSGDGYSWNDFRKRAIFLRERLLAAFGDPAIKLTGIALRYRNVEKFDHSQNNVIDFVKENLNLSIDMPRHFPGDRIAQPLPIDQKIQLGYNLLVPPAFGVLNISTGFTTEEKQDENGDGATSTREVVLWQFDIVTDETHSQDITDVQVYEQWLDMAHSTVHEWFFALIDGPLRQSYERA